MRAKTGIYIPAVFRSFQGFKIKDIKEWRARRVIEIHLESEPERAHCCGRCEGLLGAQRDRRWHKARHMRVMGWVVVVCFWLEKRFCKQCNKTRSERVDFLCPDSPVVSEFNG